MYDHAAGQLRLYVNGQLAGSRDGVTLWVVGGGFSIGRGKVNGQPAEFFAGAIDEVQTDVGVVSDDQIARRGVSTNLALHRPSTASSQCLPAEGPDKAVNGGIAGGLADKWCAANTGTKWLWVDLGAAAAITEFVVHHANAGGESPALNTRDFTIEVSDDGTSWATVVTVVGNTAGVTMHPVSVSGRYARLNITQPTSDGNEAARIYEFEVKGTATG